MRRLTEPQFWCRVKALARVAAVQDATFPDDSAVKRAARRADAICDLRVFLQTYCPHYITSPFAAFHDELFRAAAQAWRSVLVAPRGHAKSTILTFGYGLYKLVVGTVLESWASGELARTDPLLSVALDARKAAGAMVLGLTTIPLGAPFIVISSCTQEQAEEFTAAIKMELEQNGLIEADWGQLVTDAGVNYDDFVTTTGVRMKAIGLRASRRGVKNRQHRPWLWIIDDPDDDATTSSEEVRNRHFRRLTAFVMPALHPRFGRIFIVGNRVHADGWVSRIYDDAERPAHEQRFQGWERHLWKALPDHGPILWPEYFTREGLEELRRYDPEVFEREFNNEPVSDSARWFPTLWYYDPAIYAAKKLPTVLVCDPALGRSRDSDYQAVGVVSLDMRQGWFLVREAHLVRLPIPRLRTLILDLYARWKPDLLGIEDVGFQILLGLLIEEEGDRRGLFPPVVPIQQHDGKDLRIQSLIPLNSRGLIRFPLKGETAAAERQMRLQPEGKKDWPDLTEMAIRLLRQATGERTSGARGIRHTPSRRATFGKGAW